MWRGSSRPEGALTPEQPTPLPRVVTRSKTLTEATFYFLNSPSLTRELSGFSILEQLSDASEYGVCASSCRCARLRALPCSDLAADSRPDPQPKPNRRLLNKKFSGNIHKRNKVRDVGTGACVCGRADATARAHTMQVPESLKPAKEEKSHLVTYVVGLLVWVVIVPSLVQIVRIAFGV